VNVDAPAASRVRISSVVQVVVVAASGNVPEPVAVT
jgi:hypothetical protein